MNKNDLIIRLEQKDDYKNIETLVRNSFWNVYRPGCYEHFVLNQMRNSPDFVPELDFVMELGGKPIGQNVFIKAHINGDDGTKIPVAAMGPICIAPEYRRKGYGKILLDYSLQKAKKYGFKAVCIEGNVDFYGKSGFTFASDFNIRYHDLPNDADSKFFLCKELQNGYLDGVSGEYTPPSVYFVDESQVEEFDKSFPHKEKLVFPGQLF